MRGLTFHLTPETKEAQTDLKLVSDKLVKLTDTIHKVKLGADDKEAQVSLKDIDLRLDKIGRKVARPHVSVAGITRASLELDKLDLKLDSLNRKRSGLSGLAERMFTGGAPSPSLGGTAGFIGIGSLVALAAALMPSLVPLAIGAATAGGGAAGAIALNKPARKQATGILSGLESSFLQGITQHGTATRQVNIGGKTGFETVKTPSFLQGLTVDLKQVSGFTKTLGPQLSQMFRASLPFLNMFTKSMEQAAKVLLPAFTQSMKAITPVLPTISRGFAQLSLGVAGFLKAMGPGIRASADIFLATTTAVRAILVGLGHTFAWLAISIDNWSHRARANFDQFRHDVAVAFDETRHAVASAWNATWNDTIGAFIRFTETDVRMTSSLRHSIASVFDGIRHDVAAIWNSAWNTTIGAAQRGASAVIGVFRGMVSTINGILHSIAHIAINPLGSISGALGAVTGIHGFASGGWIREPVVGVGMSSRSMYTFAERGPEFVSPSGSGSGGLTVVNNFNGLVNDPYETARQIHQSLRAYKKRVLGNKELGLA